MTVGQQFPSEIRATRDAATRRVIRQLTSGRGHGYHLYYQTYCMTPDGWWLLFYSERDGTTDIFRLDRHEGTITQLTAGRSGKTGWWPWTAMEGQGVYGYISCLNLKNGELYYHDRDEVRAVNVETFEDRFLANGPPGMRPFSQMACSPDGRFVATVWTDQETADRVEASHQEARKHGLPIQQAELYWRNVVQCRLEVIDTNTREVTTLVDERAPFHNMAFAADNRHIVVVTSPGEAGSFLIADCKRPGKWERLDPPEGIGTFCHFHAGENGRISFDANVQDENRQLLATFIGQINLDGSDPQVWSLGYSGYCHVGHDPAGTLLFAAIDNGNDCHGHHIAEVRPLPDGTAQLRRLTGDLPSGTDQRWHAHPVLTPDRQAILYTAMGDGGFCHLYEVDAADLNA